MMLVRHVVRQTFVLLHHKKWASALVTRHMDVFQAVALNTAVPSYRGVVLHVLDVWIDELLAAPANSSSSNQTLPSDAFQSCLQPFYVMVCNHHDTHIIQRATDRIIHRCLSRLTDGADQGEEGEDAVPAALPLNLHEELGYTARLMFDIGAESYVCACVCV
jgi:hypothetical protein